MNKCQCTLKDVVSARYCRYCDPQGVIDDLLLCVAHENEDYRELYEPWEEIQEILHEICGNTQEEGLHKIGAVLKRVL